MSFCSEKWIKSTRKPHSCWWCDQRIEAGSAAHYAIGQIEGDLSYGYAHPECQAAIDSLPTDELADGWMPGDYARGRADDEHGQPPQFSPDYRGRR